MDAFGLTEQLSNFIIRPPRNSYSISELGSSFHNLGEQTFEYKKAIY